MPNADKIVVCPQCGAKNRLGNPPQGQVPVCGSCKRPLPWLVDAEAGLSLELQAAVPVLVDFWAAWCGPCKVIAPVLEEIAAEYAGRVKVVKLDVDRHPLAQAAYHVQGIPTLILFKDGQPVDRMVGALPKPALLQKLLPHLAPKN